ncbi:MAG: hypothetical protein E7430_05360 [Ruminococcaceae bacterium]|nr:hypothetical protein [Oscillospiraceae bacterium]
MFEIVGNEALVSRLEKAARAGSLSHFYIIGGPEGSGRRTLATQLAAAMECTASDVPCLKCAQCRKVLGNIHPDVTVISSDKQTIGVEPVRRMRTDAYIRPNEGKRRIFIIPEAETLTVQAQNVMLKLLEEPPGTASFMLLTDNPGALLQTVRSRAVELSMNRLTGQQVLNYLLKLFPEKREQAQRAADSCGGLIGKALELMEDSGENTAAEDKAREIIKHIKNRDRLAVAAMFTSFERASRGDFEALLTALLEQFAAQAPKDSRFIQQADTIGRAIEYFRANVSTAHICGYLSAAITQLL